MTRRNTVRAGEVYVYDPVMWDVLDGPTNAAKGQLVRVVNKPGCPTANTMRHCHIETLDGVFLGLVHTNSLQKVMES